jgi:hypothetical protein
MVLEGHFFISIMDLLEENFEIKSQFSWNYIIWGTKDHFAMGAKI